MRAKRTRKKTMISFLLNSPELAAEWDPTNPFGPETVSVSSHKKVKWICSKDPSHKWEAEKKLGPLLPGETEYQAMVRFGYDRIWDCGKKKWELKCLQK